MMVYGCKSLALVALSACLVSSQPAAIAQTSAGAPDLPHGTTRYRAMLTTYCVTCHNARLKTGGLALDGLDLAGRGE